MLQLCQSANLHILLAGTRQLPQQIGILANPSCQGQSGWSFLGCGARQFPIGPRCVSVGGLLKPEVEHNRREASRP